VGVLRELGLHSAVVLPLRAGGRVLGALTLAMGDSGRHYTGETLELAESVAAQAASALVNARLYAEQAAIAQTLQRSLLPPRLPKIEGLDLAACYRPAGRGAEVGGDFYDVLPAGPDAWRFLIGDVVGKGAEAAALTALVRYTLQGAEMAEASLAAKLDFVNDALLHRSSLVEFCSAVYGTVRVADGAARISLVSCGHPPPLVRRADGRIEQVPSGGPLLGAFPGPRFREHALALEAGDVLLLYTDGVIELPGRDPWRGMGLLEETLAGAHETSGSELVDCVERAVLDASASRPRDDIALLAIRVPTSG
jgi:serine phosphatase RsbU (regulator of sigma subunit)